MRLKLTDQILKIADKIIKKLITEQQGIGEMQFGFMLRCVIIKTMFISRQLQE